MLINILNLHRNNLGSLKRVFKNIGLTSVCIDQVKDIKKGQGLIIPGVGSFSSAMSALDSSGEKNRLIEAIHNASFVIGICLGMQILATSSSEGGSSFGLNIIPGKVKSFKETLGYKIPNIGWQKSIFTTQKLFNIENNNNTFYHVHSYYFNVKEKKNIYAYSKYCNINFPTIVCKNNIYGIQFHPEISGYNGELLLKNIIMNYV